MANLQDTTRCDYFSKTAKDVWNEIVFHHQAGVDADERGITKRMIAGLRHSVNTGLWSNPGYKEYENGSDIDVFVETGVNEFIWFALQAKILKQDLKYDNIDKQTNNVYQWDMLRKLQRRSGCVSLYLFFNGIDKVLADYTDCCKRDFKESQYGCSIVDINDIVTLSGNLRSIGYKDLHPRYAHPWRELVCCKKRRKSDARFTLDQVKQAVSLYTNEFNSDILDKDNTNETEGAKQEDENAIVAYNKEVERSVEHTIVVRTTAGLNQ